MARSSQLLIAALAGCSCVTSANAGVIASTNFDTSTLGGSNDIKTNLSWTVNGVNDPGDMAALNASSNPQTIFNGNGFVQDIFVPGLNTGNGNTFWTTDIALTVAAGFAVTLEDVTFNSVSVNGGQAENVNRRNDYTAFLFNPSNVLVQEVTVPDTLAGNVAGQPLVTLTFANIALSDPGTYTLRIKGGDFTGTNETGNHTGIDNLSINGTVVPEPSALALLGLGGLLAVRRRRD